MDGGQYRQSLPRPGVHLRRTWKRTDRKLSLFLERMVKGEAEKAEIDMLHSMLLELTKAPTIKGSSVCPMSRTTNVFNTGCAVRKAKRMP